MVDMWTRNLLCFSIMVMGQTMAMNLEQHENQRIEEASGLDLRASNLITYQCLSSGAKGCLDCGSFPFCASAGTSAYKISCNSTQVCENKADGRGTCVNFRQATQCECVAAYGVDPYDPSKYLTCLVGRAPTVSQCPTGQVFDFVYEKCSTTTANTANCLQGPGNFLLTCTQGYYCDSQGAIPLYYTQCPTEQVFDVSTTSCVSRGSLTIPAFTCVNRPEGAIADNLECDAFRLCIGGEEVGTKNCCPSGQVFSEPIMRCTTDANIVTCPSKSPCDTNTYTYTCSGITVTGTGTSTGTSPGPGPVSKCAVPTCSKNGPYPYTSDCKDYYFCTGGKAILQKCPTQLLFDSTKKFCTNLSDWKGCSCV